MDLKSLNKNQYGCVSAPENTIMVFAGAGTGKTRVLTYRIAYLIKHKNLNPFHMLALTFTNKAADEMKERIARLTGIKKSSLYNISTFHSICSKILKIEKIREGFNIYDENDQKNLIKEVLKDLSLDAAAYHSGLTADRINKYKDSFLISEKYYEFEEDEVYGRIFKQYEYKLAKYKAFDFGDLIFRTYFLFKNNKDILEKYREKFQYIFVDEYHDTNTIQYEFVLLLAGVHKNLFVVGDDDQSIYGWRGANIDNIFKIKNDFPEIKIFYLNENYRSSQGILDLALYVVKQNKKREKKTLFSALPASSEEPLIKGFKTDKEEAAFVAREIQNDKADGVSDVAVLLRTNHLTRLFEEEFLKRNMAYAVISGVGFYERKEIKDIIAYLKYMTNPSDLLSLKRIINTPRRGIGEKSFEKIYGHISNFGYDFSNVSFSEKILFKIKEFLEIINGVKKASLSVRETVEKLIKKINYETSFENDDEIIRTARRENIGEFLNLAAEFDKNPENKEKTLKDFVDEITLISDVDAMDETTPSVKLMTIHSAKGLEFDAVYMPCVEDGILPHKNSCETEKEIEEERRLFYVAATRAKKKLVLSYARKRYIFGNEVKSAPSYFIAEKTRDFLSPILCENPIFSNKNSENNTVEKNKLYDTIEIQNEDDFDFIAAGKRVYHKKFKTGVVIQKEGKGIETKARVLFDNSGERLLMLKYAGLKLIK